MADVCPEAVYGIHGETDRDGRCPWCRRKVGAKMMRPGLDLEALRRWARDRDPMQLEPSEDDYYDA